MMSHCCRCIARIWISHWWPLIIFQIKSQTQMSLMSCLSKIVEMPQCQPTPSRPLAPATQLSSCRGPRVPWGAAIIGALRPSLRNWLKWPLKLAGQDFWFWGALMGVSICMGGKGGWLTDSWLISPWLMLCPPRPTVLMCPWPRSWTKWWKQGRVRSLISWFLTPQRRMQKRQHLDCPPRNPRGIPWGQYSFQLMLLPPSLKFRTSPSYVQPRLLDPTLDRNFRPSMNLKESPAPPRKSKRKSKITYWLYTISCLFSPHSVFAALFQYEGESYGRPFTPNQKSIHVTILTW